jgi:hypothetical protein
VNPGVTADEDIAIGLLERRAGEHQWLVRTEALGDERGTPAAILLMLSGKW